MKDLTESMNNLTDLGEWLGLIQILAHDQLDERYICPPSLLRMLSKEAMAAYNKAFEHLDHHASFVQRLTSPTD